MRGKNYICWTTPMLFPLQVKTTMTPPLFLALYVCGFLLAASIRLWYTQEYRRKIKDTGWKPALDTWLVYLPAIGMFIVPALYILTPFLAAADYLDNWTNKHIKA